MAKTITPTRARRSRRLNPFSSAVRPTTASRPLGRSDGDFADKINSMPKYVVFSTLTDPEWENTTVLSGDPVEEVTKLREAGDLEGIDAGQPLAVALTGRIAATTYSYEGDYGVEFAAMVPPGLLEPGDNAVEVLAIERAGGTVTLRPLSLSF